MSYDTDKPKRKPGDSFKLTASRGGNTELIQVNINKSLAKSLHPLSVSQIMPMLTAYGAALV